jgi:hypothetical protein
MTNVYHIAGLDDRERGFNRQAQVIAQGVAYQARLRYEALQIEVESVKTQERGYSQLRTQRIFQGQQYLGNQELWVEYPDSELPDVQSISWFMRIRGFLGIGKQ